MEAPGCLIFCILTPCSAHSVCFCTRTGSSFCLHERPLLFRAHILLWLFRLCAAFSPPTLSFVPPTCSCASSRLVHLFHAAPTNSKEPPVRRNILTIPTTTGVGLPGSGFTGPRERPACCIRVRWPLHTASEPVLRAACVRFLLCWHHFQLLPARSLCCCPLVPAGGLSGSVGLSQDAQVQFPSSGSTSGFWEAHLCSAVSRRAAHSCCGPTGCCQVAPAKLLPLDFTPESAASLCSHTPQDACQPLLQVLANTPNQAHHSLKKSPLPPPNQSCDLPHILPLRRGVGGHMAALSVLHELSNSHWCLTLGLLETQTMALSGTRLVAYTYFLIEAPKLIQEGLSEQCFYCYNSHTLKFTI